MAFVVDLGAVLVAVSGAALGVALVADLGAVLGVAFGIALVALGTARSNWFDSSAGTS
ncbi:MAG TPA: hypothetical protein VH165_37345 [Kofleriaceae bacterium]|nr:hypothetical protein [Kofleriaceae bacterium]